MNKLLGIVVLGLLISGKSISATPSSKDFKKNEKNKVYAKRDVNYFTSQGYNIVLQETRGTTTAYVLKKFEEYIGCKSTGLSKEQTCYIIELINNEKN